GEARDVLSWFCPTSPSTEVIERAVLGLGRHTDEWFRTAPVPNCPIPPTHPIPGPACPFLANRVPLMHTGRYARDSERPA
ncbi:MAG: hypothetical protein RBU45_25410, partial [Myxococcota bacterium]|nr:hypothetical protein [Myxococcota bacterium]